MLSLLLPVLAASATPAIQAASHPDARQRRAVLERVADLVRDRYVRADHAARIAAAIREDARSARFADAASADDFAARVTARLRAISGDGHFALERRATSSGAGDDRAELERWYGTHVNHGFERVERLEGGIGYLDLRVFAPVSMGGDLAAAAMTLLAQSPALIIDLRRNGGGMDDMTRLLAAYLLDDVREMSGKYDRPSGRTTKYFTPKNVEGRRFGGAKPVYVLVSRRTFSAAEAFAYDLQAMKRAVVVGERTGGGAHPFEYRSAGHGYVLSLPEGRSVSPITGTDWEGVGVKPDVEVSADQALETALSLAQARLEPGGRAPGGKK